MSFSMICITCNVHLSQGLFGNLTFSENIVPAGALKPVRLRYDTPSASTFPEAPFGTIISS